MLGIGLPEVLILFLLLIVYAIPIAAVIWIILTLRHIGSDLKAIRNKLEAIEQLLQSGFPG